MIAKPLVRLWNLGRLRYLPALRVQESLVKHLKSELNQKENVLLVVEHEPVYTTGIRTKEYTKAEEERLVGLGADFVRTNRGGLITFHGPGQLVAYPILNLLDFLPAAKAKKSLLGMKWYVDKLEQTVIDSLKPVGLSGERSPHTGVWLGDNKVCAMGVHNSGFVTSHGLALNCNVDLSWYGHIVPCGIRDKGVTSVSRELGSHVTIQDMLPHLVTSFENNFDCEIDQSREEQVPDYLID